MLIVLALHAVLIGTLIIKASKKYYDKMKI